MITKFGKRFLTNYLAGNVSFDNKDLALGIGSTPGTKFGDPIIRAPSNAAPKRPKAA